MGRYVLDLFLSSTSEDLRVHRDTVAEALGRMLQSTVRMESFGAKPSKPLDTCRQEVERCDALIVLVGHRYGWIPSAREGGDDEKSITWWEVQWALDAGRPVYAFLVDQEAPWTGPREQDALIRAASEAESVATWRAVKRLQAFRAFLEKETTRVLFRNADHLASLVVSSLFQWLLQHAAPVRPSAPGDDAPAPVVPPDQPAQVTSAAPRPGQHYWLEQIHAGSARASFPAPDAIKVAIISGHPRLGHPALRGVPITTVAIGETPAAGAGDDHTTTLAALIGGTGAAGFTGVAPGVELLAMSVLDPNGVGSNAGIATAIDRAVVGGARILCLALGSAERSEVLDDALAEANEAGVIAIAAAGNDGSERHIYPAASDFVISVGAVDPSGRATAWTTRGAWVDVSAPGQDLWVPAGDDGYARSNGTSWSCAIVAGVAALVLGARPGLTSAQVRDILIATGHPVVSPGAGAATGPVVNAFGAVQRALQSGLTGPSNARRPRPSSPRRNAGAAPVGAKRPTMRK
ncbi:MAG: S8 family serine peptidase [Vicinamibacterales bacterium]